MQTLTEIENTLREKPAVMLYFSAPTCNVCHALKPKLVDAIETNFDAVEIVSIDISESPEIASHYSVFAIPTLLVFLDGREFLRKSRHMSVGEVVESIRRPYEIMFS
ncbi:MULTISPECIES: thioredoxin family protein [Sulfurimonas]|uniref:Thioredoxin family protein n=1 Tax=Sulfurimonas diazotrophicus TaxID=3131939 RepID=A0ABZ3HAX4_9BACT